MKRFFFIGAVIALATVAAAQPKTKTPVKAPVVKAPLKNLLDSFSYAVGLNIASNLKMQNNITKLNTAMLQRAFDDVLKNRPALLPPDQINAVIQKQLQILKMQTAGAEIEKGRAFLANNAKRKGVNVLPNGLQYEVLKKSDTGTIKPNIMDTAIVHYMGTLIDGKEFDNSYKRGMSATFKLTEVIAGWTEILQLMHIGDKWKVYIPTELAYYMNPRDPSVIPPGAALIFEMSLEGIKPVQ
jgi:FKBP-type peptidyl-prolyl cis-trans isomerase FklB